MSESKLSDSFRAIGVQDDRHTAREINALRGSVEELVQLTRTQMLPAISGISDRLGAIEVRVERLESDRPSNVSLRPPLATAMAIALLALATLGFFGGVVWLASAL